MNSLRPSLRDLDVVREDAAGEVPGDLAGVGRDPVDAVVDEGRDEQLAPVARQRHVIGAHRVQRPRPQRAAAGDVEGGDIAEVAARHVEGAAVGRHVGVLRVVGRAGSFALHLGKVDGDGADDRTRGHVHHRHLGALGVGHERDLDRLRRALRLSDKNKLTADRREHDRGIDSAPHACLQKGHSTRDASMASAAAPPSRPVGVPRARRRARSPA